MTWSIKDDLRKEREFVLEAFNKGLRFRPAEYEKMAVVLRSAEGHIEFLEAQVKRQKELLNEYARTLEANYTKALLHNPKDTVYQNMLRATEKK